MIKLQVIGNLGKDCVVNTVNGKTVMNFNVAHTEKYRDSQGVQHDKTIWVECAYWNDRTGIAPYLKKGTQVYAEGTPEVRTYTNKEGQPGASLSMRVFSVQLLGSRAAGDQETSEPQPYQQPATQSSSGADLNEPMDDLPF